jgi:hypothetical protein
MGVEVWKQFLLTLFGKSVFPSESSWKFRLWQRRRRRSLGFTSSYVIILRAQPKPEKKFLYAGNKLWRQKVFLVRPLKVVVSCCKPNILKTKQIKMSFQKVRQRDIY